MDTPLLLPRSSALSRRGPLGRAVPIRGSASRGAAAGLLVALALELAWPSPLQARLRAAGAGWWAGASLALSAGGK